MPKATKKPAVEREEDQKEEERIALKYLPLEEATPIYANHLQILIGPWDLTFRFGIITAVGEAIGAKELTRVVVSPQHAKAILRLLERQVKLYEERHGEIPDLTKDAQVMEVAPN